MKNKLIGTLLIIFSLTFIPLKNIIITKSITNKAQITENKIIEESYYAILKIPKINLIQELYSSNNQNNSLKNALLVHNKSIFPSDINNSNVIIAGHSGTNPKSYFKNLFKLNKNDLIILYYQNEMYTYEIMEIETLPKTGELNIKNFSNNIITLITCTKNNAKTQTIYYAKLKNRENIVKN